MTDSLSLYSRVPKTLEANLRYRKKLRERAVEDPAFRAAMMQACKQDVLFWLNAFCWLYEPRVMRGADGKKLPQVIPFITWEHQDPVILTIRENLGERDIGIEKARGEGASWITVAMAVHDFLFDDMSAVGLVSRTEAAVDSPGDPDSMLWKADFLLEKMPDWMSGEKGKDYERSYTKHVLRNLKNGATIVGYSATGDVASGGRKKWFGMDELAKFPRPDDADAMASTEPVTESRLIVSTPKGSEGAYYEAMHEPSSMVRLVLDWKGNPSRNRGLYTLVDGKPVATDPVNNPLQPDYDPPSQEILDMWSRLRKKGFKLEGTVRSPWYDKRCDRPRMTPQFIAQEYDRDYGGSMFRVFGNEFNDKAKHTVRPPFATGTLAYHPEKLTPDFSKGENGPIQIWTTLDSRNQPPHHQFAVGADVSSGVGGAFTSNSVVTVIDLVTMDQVLELAVNTMAPADFADLCMSIGYWFHTAYLSWEHNGPGTAFTKRVLEMRYPHIYRRTSLWRGGKKKTKEVGWWTDKKTKEAMFSELHRSVKTGELTLRSEPLLRECGQYVRLNGIIEHVGNKNSKDDATSGESHGDRVIAAGVALMAARDRPLMAATEHVASEPPPGTLAERQRMWDEEDERKRSADDWDDRTAWDLAHPGMGKLLRV